MTREIVLVKAPDDTVTVGALIEVLQQLPRDARVWTEGCDCIGAARSIDYDDNDNTVMICRQ